MALAEQPFYAARASSNSRERIVPNIARATGGGALTITPLPWLRSGEVSHPQWSSVHVSGCLSELLSHVIARGGQTFDQLALGQPPKEIPAARV